MSVWLAQSSLAPPACLCCAYGYVPCMHARCWVCKCAPGGCGAEGRAHSSLMEPCLQSSATHANTHPAACLEHTRSGALRSQHHLHHHHHQQQQQQQQRRQQQEQQERQQVRSLAPAHAPAGSDPWEDPKWQQYKWTVYR